MTNFYLDIETAGTDAERDQILTIQFQPLDRATGRPIGDLRILKAWESSEKQIIGQFIAECRVMGPYPTHWKREVRSSRFSSTSTVIYSIASSMSSPRLRLGPVTSTRTTVVSIFSKSCAKSSDNCARIDCKGETAVGRPTHSAQLGCAGLSVLLQRHRKMPKSS